jgi:hypothetical protein
MKRLLQRLGIFFLLLVLIKMPFVVFFDDVFFYRESDLTKEELMRRDLISRALAYRRSEFNKQEFDTVFIGSSRAIYGIIPPYFDALTRNQTKSYNFGINYGLPPQIFDWCEELIESKASLKRVFFELSGPLESVSASGDFSFTGRFDQLETDLNNLVIPFFKPRLSAKEYKINYKKDKRAQETDFRFQNIVYRDVADDYNIPLEKVFEKKNDPPNNRLSLRELELSRLRSLQVEKENYADSFDLDEDYWKRISRLIQLAESKQIRLYFFIPPRLISENELKTIYPVYQKLDAKYKFGVPHYDESLFVPDTSFDYIHLNHKGALRFTELMAETFNNRQF